MPKPRVRANLSKKIFATIALIIWTGGVLYLTQFLTALLFREIAKTATISHAALLTVYSATSYLLAFIIIVLVPFLLAKHLKKPDASILSFRLRKCLGLLGLPTWTDIILAPAAFIISTLLSGLTTGLFTAIFPWFDAAEKQNVGFDTTMIGPDRALAFLSIVIIAPIIEELIFRGFLYNRLKSVFYKSKDEQSQSTETPQAFKSTSFKKLENRSEIVAIIIATLFTSLLFALMHGQWNVAVDVFVMSIVLCCIREITGTTYAGILMHMTKNLVAFFILFVVQSGL